MYRYQWWEMFCFLSARHAYVIPEMSLHLVVFLPLTVFLNSNCEYCKQVQMKSRSQTEKTSNHITRKMLEFFFFSFYFKGFFS